MKSTLVYNSSSNQEEEYKALQRKVRPFASKDSKRSLVERICSMDDQVPCHPLTPLLLLESEDWDSKKAIEEVLGFMAGDLGEVVADRNNVEKRAVALLKNCLESKHLDWVCMGHFDHPIYDCTDDMIMNMQDECWVAVIDALLEYQKHCTLHKCDMYEDKEGQLVIDKHEHIDETAFKMLLAIIMCYGYRFDTAVGNGQKLNRAVRHLLKTTSMGAKMLLQELGHSKNYHDPDLIEFICLMLHHSAISDTTKKLESAEKKIRKNKHMPLSLKKRCYRIINDGIYAQEKAFLHHRRLFRDTLAYLETNLDFGSDHLGGFLMDAQLESEAEKVAVLASLPIHSTNSLSVARVSERHLPLVQKLKAMALAAL